MNVLCRTAVVSQQSQPLSITRSLQVINTRISVRTEVLARIKAETSDPARSAYAECHPVLSRAPAQHLR